jgi:hypothetical protein
MSGYCEVRFGSDELAQFDDGLDEGLDDEI